MANRAQSHLRKSGEFLEAARSNLTQGWYAAAASCAVTSGINAKDALCLTLTGNTRKTDRHHEAVQELRAAGAVGRGVTPTFERLLRLKDRSQYRSEPISSTDAAKAVDWASRIYSAALQAVPSPQGSD